MATYRAVEVNLPECERLCDLTSIRRDFERCRDMCEKLSLGAPAPNLDAATIDALATAIPVVYSRAFNGGIRLRVGHLIQKFNFEDQEYHSAILEMRSKYSAHSINGMERQHVRVWLNPEERGRKINNVNAAMTSLLALSSLEYQRLREMCDQAVAWVDTELDIESARLSQLIGDMFSLDDLYAMDQSVSNCAGLKEVSKGRPRTKKSS